MLPRQVDILSRELRALCPEMWEEFQSAVACNRRILYAIDVLLVLYHQQNVRIHREAMGYNANLSLAGRERHWIRSGKPELFFHDMKAFHPEIFGDTLFAAWNAFQALLLVLHWKHLRWIYGRSPTQAELLSPKWFSWSKRLRKRYEPIFH